MSQIEWHKTSFCVWSIVYIFTFVVLDAPEILSVQAVGFADVGVP
jgi:hypothetical protein